MNKKITINEKEYEVIENYKDGIDIDAITEKMTDYYDDYEYIVGDWAYGKLRMKGFKDSNNKNAKDFNDISRVKEYLNTNCAYECKYFIIKKLI